MCDLCKIKLKVSRTMRKVEENLMKMQAAIHEGDMESCAKFKAKVAKNQAKVVDLVEEHAHTVNMFDALDATHH